MRKMFFFSFIQGGPDNRCQAGLHCILTKKLIQGGQVYPVKQCMPVGMEIDVETVDFDNQSDDVSRTKRFLFNVRMFLLRGHVMDVFMSWGETSRKSKTKDTYKQVNCQQENKT